MGFPCGSAGKEPACNVGDLCSVPRLGRSPGEGNGYPLQYSWASLVAQLVKNPLAIWETWVQSLGWEDPLEKGKATYSSILVWRIPWTVYSPGDCKESDMTARLSLSAPTTTWIITEKRNFLFLISTNGIFWKYTIGNGST